MKILCPQCFKQIENIKNNIAICDCGFEYNIKNKSSLYRIRLDGGYIKEGMTYKDIIKNIEDGGILADELIAAQDGPWITICDSPFAKHIPTKNIKSKNSRTAIAIYKRKKRGLYFVIALSTLLVFSIGVNIFLLTLMTRMQIRIEELITKITGG